MIEIDKLSKIYSNSNSETVVFSSFSLSIDEGVVTAILGPSGCGKTTLLKMIAGLDSLTSGSIKFKYQKHRIGMVFQEYTAFPWLSVAKNIEFGLKLEGRDDNYQKEQIDYWLDKMELTHARELYPHQISGGMKQRLAIARCLTLKPDILLMDEPFGALDAITRSKMIDFTEKLLEELKITSIIVTHNIREAIQLADQIIVLSLPPIREVNKTFISNMERPRTSLCFNNSGAIGLEVEIFKELKEG